MNNDKFEKWLEDCKDAEENRELFNQLRIISACYSAFKAEQSHKAIVDLNGLIGCPNCHCAVDVSDAHNPEQGLVEELRRWSNGCMRRGPDGEPDGCFGIMEFEEILSRHTAKVDKDEEVVPLAVLGRKYDLYITFVWNDVQWFCHISDGRGDIKKILNGATYSAAELKARQYLEGLPDRKGE